MTSEVQIYFDTRGVDCIMSSPNADLIAVSLACPMDAKSPCHEWGLLTALFELVGITMNPSGESSRLEGIAVLVQSKFVIFDISRSAQNYVKLSRIIILHFWGFIV